MLVRSLAVSMALVVGACAQTPVTADSPSDSARRRPLSEAETCAMIVAVARQIGEGPFDVDVKRESGATIDCQVAFKASGLAIFPASRLNDPRVGMSVQDRGYVFSEPRFTDDTEAVIVMDFVCRRLCGHGEEVTVRLNDGAWKITERKTTWIS